MRLRRCYSGGVPTYPTRRTKGTMDSSRSSANRRLPAILKLTDLRPYYNPSEQSSASGPELKSSHTSAYLASSGSLNAKHRELLELELASQRRARPRARVAEGSQDVKEAKRDLESFAYTPLTGRISRPKKSIPAHTCDICKPAKV